MIISFGAPAQTTGHTAQKRTVVKTQQKTKKQKTKTSETKAAAAEGVDITTLKDEKAHKAKRSFEEMLRRRLEVDAEEGERQQRKE